MDANLGVLLTRLNVIREAYGKPMTVTSGLRSSEQQQELIKEGKSKASKSKHLTGQAADIYDPSGVLKAWIMAHLDLVTETGFWFEDFKSTPNWVHFQIVPPASGKLFFLP